MSLRVLARTGVALLAVSTAFPVLAALLYPSNPARWLGVADVATATLVFVAMATLAARARNVVTDDDRIAALRIGQGVAAIVPALLAAYFIVGPRVNWTVLVIGLAWRGWLLFYCLPFVVAGLAANGPTADRSP